MPEQINLDDSSYNTNYESALQKLKARAPWWGHIEASDPGVTMLELFSMLNDMQSYYMNMVQESHFRKYLKLLSEERDMGCPAEAWVCIDNMECDLCLPAGTRFLAEDMVFETIQEEPLCANKIIALFIGEERKASTNQSEQMAIHRQYRLALPGRSEKGSQLLRIVLEKPVAAGESVTIHITVRDTNGRNRPLQAPYRMAVLRWEYFTDTGWQQAEETADTTYGLLFTGKVILRLPHTIVKRQDNCGSEGYQLRCMLETGCYDVVPVLGRVRLNVVSVRQTNTLCRTSYMDYDGGQEAWLPLRHYLEKTGIVDIYVHTSGGLWESFRPYCEVTPTISTEQPDRYLYVSKQTFGRIPPAGKQVIKVVSRHSSYWEEYNPVRITGISTQRIPLPWHGIYKPSVSIQLRTGDNSPYYIDYRCAEPEEDQLMQAWHWEESEDVIVLGDGRHGDIPGAAEDGLCITSLVLCEGETGNISGGKINRLENPALFHNITCHNQAAGRGGRNRKTAREQFEELAEREGSRNQKRAVTKEDYADIVKRTPGLIIKETDADMDGHGAVTVRVFVSENMQGKDCLNRYKREILEHIGRYKMITAKVELSLIIQANAEAEEQDEETEEQV